ncbi:hypothetical protein AB4560_09690 [Vibrio sp. 10N.222.51.C12]|uniref:hypothetical protein n=1 Tax=Vibrio sp. 10N.222.51.C12 TaxID=3229622 RepID=UPI0035501BE1
MTEKQIDRTSVFATCDAMVKDQPNAKITNRLVASQMGVSPTAVYKFVKQWREDMKNKQEELITQTKMSSKFVTALLAEVNERVTEMRQLDESERIQVSLEMDDMAEQVASLEVSLRDLRKQLETRTVALATTEEKLEQANNALASAESFHTEQIAQLESEQAASTKDLVEDHGKALTKLEEQIESLTEKLETKTSELQVMTKDFAKAQVKAEEYDTLVEVHAHTTEKLEVLINQNATLKAQQEATAMNIANLEASNADNIEQRNRAQEELKEVATNLRKTLEELQTKTLEFVTLEAGLQEKKEELVNKKKRQ